MFFSSKEGMEYYNKHKDLFLYKLSPDLVEEESSDVHLNEFKFLNKQGSIY